MHRTKIGFNLAAEGRERVKHNLSTEIYSAKHLLKCFVRILCQGTRTLKAFWKNIEKVEKEQEGN
jgi:hypothetical protein